MEQGARSRNECSVNRESSIENPASRIRDSASEDSEKRPDWASEAIMARTAAASRPVASNNSRSKFEDTWMSIDGDEVATTSRTS